MSGSADLSTALDLMVGGKRISPRLPVSLPVLIKAVHREFDATVEDLSAEGARLRLEESALTGGGKSHLEAAEQFTLIEKHFRDSFDLHFREALVVTEAELMRLSLSTDGSGALGLGCRFVHPLSAMQQEKLGIGMGGGPDDLWDTAVASADLRWGQDPVRPVTGLLLGEYDVVSGPLFIGRLTRLGRSAVLVHLDGVSRDVAGDGLSGRNPRLRILSGSRELLLADVRCLATRYVDAPRPGTELLLELPGKAPRNLRRYFRRA